MRAVLKTLKERFHECLKACKSLDMTAMAKSVDKKDVEGITADKIIYKHAIDMCQSAALEELFGNPDEVSFFYSQGDIGLFIYFLTNVFYLLLFVMVFYWKNAVLPQIPNSTDPATLSVSIRVGRLWPQTVEHLQGSRDEEAVCSSRTRIRSCLCKLYWLRQEINKIRYYPCLRISCGSLHHNFQSHEKDFNHNRETSYNRSHATSYPTEISRRI